MRMRELEQRSGVGRETIRYYIREGLLPEPERATRNSASYSDAHVERLHAIKRLQEERFLPLSVIKALLEAGEADRWLHAEAFPRLDSMLRARLDGGGERLTRDALLARLSIPADQLDDALEAGAVRMDPDGRIDARNAAIMARLAELSALGFDRENGFEADGLRMYVDFVDWLVTTELRHFFDRTAGRVGELEAVDMAERALAAVNDMLGLMRTREVLRRLEARRRIANDNN